MRLLVTGTRGQVVTALLERAAAAGDVDVIALGRPELDLAEPEQAARAIAAQDFDVLVNAAAHTAVDRAESEPKLAHRINCDGAAAAARAAASRGAPIIQLSTDYVFNGRKNGAWTEDDPADPLSAYGRSKLAGEQAVLAGNPNAVILRTAWVYSPFGANFARTMLRLAQTRDAVSVVSDQTGTPTNALDIADGVIAVARNLLREPQRRELYGVFHLSARPGDVPPTWADFAEEVFAASRRFGGPCAQVRRITTAEYPTPAARPANSLLDCSRLARVHGVVPPEWKASVPETVRRILQG